MLKLTAELHPIEGTFRVVDVMGTTYAKSIPTWRQAHALAGIYMAQQHEVGPPSNPDQQVRSRQRETARPKHMGTGRLTVGVRNFNRTKRNARKG